MIKIGIYGYECTREISFDSYKIIPLTNNYTEAKKLASEQHVYNLTGFLEIDEKKSTNLYELIFNLEAVLSFIDQKDVILTNKYGESEGYNNLNNEFPKTLNIHYRNSGGGKVVMSDAHSTNSRENFIEMAMNKLSDLNDTNNKVFRSAFFKTIEVFRSPRNFIDVSYYLLFSALESLSRAVFSDYKSTSSKPIANLLSKYNFDISQDNVNNLYKSVSTYSHLRNSLFHNSELETEVNINGSIKDLKLSTFYPHFRRLLPLVMMKYIGFDDGHINWNSWLDRMIFKAK